MAAATTIAATPVVVEAGSPVRRATAIQEIPQAIARPTPRLPRVRRARTVPTAPATTRTSTAHNSAAVIPGWTPLSTRAAVTLAQTATLTQPT